MKFLQKLVASMLVIAITATISVYILLVTVFNAHYLQAKLTSQQLYGSLAQALPATVVPGSTPDALVAQQGLAGLITTAYIQTKINPFLNQLQAYYTAGGPVPQLDFTDLNAEAAHQGVTIPTNSSLTGPISYSTPTGIKTAFNWINLIKLTGPIVVLVLLTLLVLLHQEWHRFTAVAKVCLAAAVAEGLVFGLFKFFPGLLDSLVKSTTNSAPMASVLVSFLKSVLADVGNDFGKAAIALVVIGVLILIAGLIAKAVGFIGRHTGSSKDGNRYTRPNPDNRPSL